MYDDNNTQVVKDSHCNEVVKVDVDGHDVVVNVDADEDDLLVKVNLIHSLFD
jgi:hypothetical protein